MPRRDACRHRGRWAAAGEQSHAPRRHSHPAAKPFEYGQLDLIRTRRDRPDAREKIESGGEPVSHDRGKSGTARDVTQEAGMRLARVVGYDALAKVFENGVERRRMLGWLGVEQFARAASI